MQEDLLSCEPITIYFEIKLSLLKCYSLLTIMAICCLKAILALYVFYFTEELTNNHKTTQNSSNEEILEFLK